MLSKAFYMFMCVFPRISTALSLGQRIFLLETMMVKAKTQVCQKAKNQCLMRTQTLTGQLCHPRNRYKDTQTYRQTYTQTHTYTDRQTEIYTPIHRHRERERDGETYTQTHRDTETQRDKHRHTDTHTQRGGF